MWLRLARTVALIIVMTALVGFDSPVSKLIDALTGRQTNIVILSKQPLTLNPVPVVLTSAEPMKVLGEWTSVCLVLRDGVPLRPQAQMDKIFSDALGGATVKTTIELSDGSRFNLLRPMMGWEHTGQILAQDEMSACASANCPGTLPRGGKVRSVEISASRPLQVRGIYWQSELGPTETRDPPDSTKTPIAQEGRIKCNGNS